MVLASHELYEEAMPRGRAGQVGRELGYADGSVPRRWRRPVATPSDLFTGELSPMMRAKAELLAQDRIDGYAADILLFSMFADLARQRARLRPDSREMIVLALAQGFHSAIKAFTIETTGIYREVELYRAGASIVRALAFVIGDDGAVGIPLRMIDDDRPTLLVRLFRALTSNRPLLCRLGLHRWQTGDTMRRCIRCPKTQLAFRRY